MESTHKFDMVPQNKSNPDIERTETVPAQEKVALSSDDSVQLSAEQVYAQRLAQIPQRENDHTQGFVP